MEQFQIIESLVKSLRRNGMRTVVVPCKNHSTFKRNVHCNCMSHKIKKEKKWLLKIM